MREREEDAGVRKTVLASLATIVRKLGPDGFELLKTASKNDLGLEAEVKGEIARQKEREEIVNRIYGPHRTPVPAAVELILQDPLTDEFEPKS